VAAAYDRAMDPAPVALVTGASRGIGRVVASHLAATGYRVAAAARSADALTQLAAERGALALALDVTDAAAVDAAVARIEEELGPIDLLVANAGVGGDARPSWEQSAAEWWHVFEVNMLGAYLCARAVTPRMRERRRGRILNVASNAAFFRLDEPFPVKSAYMASKAALIRFSEALAFELEGDGIAVFAISPGMVKSEMTAALFGYLWDEPGLWSPPELTAELVAFLAGGALDALSGRYIHAVRDDWRTMPQRIDEILTADRHALRLRLD
jgi:NAD(P)-dependent dehydrogenase (short-subunit alcohol dehydrogenase family)